MLTLREEENLQLPNFSGQEWPSIGKSTSFIGHSALIVNLYIKTQTHISSHATMHYSTTIKYMTTHFWSCLCLFKTPKAFISIYYIIIYKWYTSWCRGWCHFSWFWRVCLGQSCCEPLIFCRSWRTCLASTLWWPSGCSAAESQLDPHTSTFCRPTSAGKTRPLCTPKIHRARIWVTWASKWVSLVTLHVRGMK